MFCLYTSAVRYGPDAARLLSGYGTVSWPYIGRILAVSWPYPDLNALVVVFFAGLAGPVGPVGLAGISS